MNVFNRLVVIVLLVVSMIVLPVALVIIRFPSLQEWGKVGMFLPLTCLAPPLRC